MSAAPTGVLRSLNRRPPGRYPDWGSILKPAAARWEVARAAAHDGPKILIANSGGRDHHITTIDSVLAVALTLRGADVHILHCDEALPACKMSHHKRVAPEQFATSGPASLLCGQCFQNGSTVFEALGLPRHRYSEGVTPDERSRARELTANLPAGDIAAFELDGMAIGEHASAGALRYFARGDLHEEPHGEAILRRYFEASLLSMFAIRRLLGTSSFQSVCSHTGMYVPDGLVGEVARGLNVRTVCWAEAYRKQTLIFSHHDTYHRTMLTEPTANWANMPWTDEMELEILEYLKSRWYGTHDWIGYTRDWSDDVSAIAAGMGIDFTKPCVGLLTNVIWDAQVHYGGNAFPSMLEWTLATIRYFGTRPDLQLIVRVHPAEVRGNHPSRQLMVDEIRRAIPNAPKNVFVIGPESPMNTYAAMQKCDAVIIYGTKVGVELSSLGIPVVVAGEAWIRNKGLTLDASSAREYFAILDRLPLGERMSPSAIQQARKYAYHYFFRRLIPLPFLQQGASDALFTLEIGDLDDLRPGRYPGLDVICDGIMNGTEFIYPAEALGGPVAASGKFTLTYAGKLAGRSSSKPLVSVIIPTATPDPGSLDAVYAQAGIGTQFDVELIVVDNGSVGGGASIASPREGLKHLRLERPATAGAVRNVGLKAAKGAYVAFLDDGDLWFPERLRTQIAVLEHDVESTAVYGQFIATGDGRETLWPEAGAASAGWVFEAVLSDDFARSSFLTARREAVEQAGFFDEALDGLEMWDMLLRLSFLGRVSFVSGPAGRAHFAKDRTWLERIQKGQHQTELPYVVGKACALLPEASERRTLRRRVMSRWFIEIARRLDKAETAGLLRAHVLSSLKHDPWLLTDRRSRRPVLAYAARGLSRMLPASRRRLARALGLG